MVQDIWNEGTYKSYNAVAEQLESLIDAFSDGELLEVLSDINTSVFSVCVVATMSSGKSTFINALLKKKLMPIGNTACTATITEILGTGDESFTAVLYNKDEEIIETIPKLTYENMEKLNGNDNIPKIAMIGSIPFFHTENVQLMLVDTPGTNSSQNPEHREATYRAIENNVHDLIIYVLNGTQLATNDDAELLHHVAEQMRKGGRKFQDKIIFVLNKMDRFNPEEESIEKVIESARRYLSAYGIEEPRIFPCSAYAAFNIREYFSDLNTESLTRNEIKMMPSAIRDTIPMFDKFIEYESMHLEKYAPISSNSKKTMRTRLEKAERRNDRNEQALIHCGIYSIEAAITTCAARYAANKKLKELLERFQEILQNIRS